MATCAIKGASHPEAWMRVLVFGATFRHHLCNCLVNRKLTWAGRGSQDSSGLTVFQGFPLRVSLPVSFPLRCASLVSFDPWCIAPPACRDRATRPVETSLGGFVQPEIMEWPPGVDTACAAAAVLHLVQFMDNGAGI